MLPNPMQGRMGSPMMGPRFGGGGGPFMGMNRTPQLPMMGMNRAPQFPIMGGPPQMNSGGGLISRLLGRGTQPGGMNGLMGMQQAGRAAGGGGSFLQSLTNPGGISTFLNNTQQVLKTAQSIGPMVQQFQQYGPLIRNIPAMWKLFQGLKNAPDSDSKDSGESSASQSEKTDKTNNKKSKTSSSYQSESTSENISPTSSKHHKTKTRSRQIKYEKGASIPKLYV